MVNYTMGKRNNGQAPVIKPGSGDMSRAIPDLPDQNTVRRNYEDSEKCKVR